MIRFLGKKRRPAQRAENNHGAPGDVVQPEQDAVEALLEGLLRLHRASEPQALLRSAEDLVRRVCPGSEAIFVLEREDGLLYVESELVKQAATTLGAQLQPFPRPSEETPLGRLLAGDSSPEVVDSVSAFLAGPLDPHICEFLELHYKAPRVVGYVMQSEGERLGAVILTLADSQGLPATLRGVTNHLAAAMQRSQELTLARQIGRFDPVRWVPDESELQRELSRELSRSQRYGAPLSLALLSVKDLEGVSAEYGNTEANWLLRAVGSQLSRQIRASDFIAAHDRDGYGIILPYTDEQGASTVAKRLLRVGAKVKILRGTGPAARCVLGTATFPADGDTVEALRGAAKARLLLASSTDTTNSPRLIA